MSTQQTILITGATSGIGRHAALYLARKGHRVLATGRNEKALAELRAEGEGTGLDTLRLDVTSADSIAAARAEVDRKTDGRGVDVLVNNAGYGVAGPTEEISDADLRAQYDTNVFGLMAVTRAFLPQMRARGAGRVINVSSVGGIVTLPFFGVYNSTKYAVESLSDALRVELAPFGVRVVLIEPGVIRTNFGERSMAEVAKYRRPESPWAAALERADDIKKQSDRLAADPEVIARAMERAIRARRPRARYMAPASARLMVGFLRRLPTRWVDAVLGRFTGLTRKGLGLTPQPAVGQLGAAAPAQK
jgi:short-subunit dehydrogenase